MSIGVSSHMVHVMGAELVCGYVVTEWADDQARACGHARTSHVENPNDAYDNHCWECCDLEPNADMDGRFPCIHLFAAATEAPTGEQNEAARSRPADAGDLNPDQVL